MAATRWRTEECAREINKIIEYSGLKCKSSGVNCVVVNMNDIVCYDKLLVWIWMTFNDYIVWLPILTVDKLCQS
jgi:hypothetical protein